MNRMLVLSTVLLLGGCGLSYRMAPPPGMTEQQAQSVENECRLVARGPYYIDPHSSAPVGLPTAWGSYHTNPQVFELCMKRHNIDIVWGNK